MSHLPRLGVASARSAAASIQPSQPGPSNAERSSTLSSLISGDSYTSLKSGETRITDLHSLVSQS